MNDTLRNSSQLDSKTAEPGAVSTKESGRFAKLTRGLSQAVAFAAAMAVPQDAFSRVVIEPGETKKNDGEEKLFCYHPAKPKKPTPPKEAEDAPTEMQLRTPNVSESTYYIVRNGATVPKGSPLSNIKFDTAEDTATIYVDGPVDLCFGTIAKVPVVQEGKGKSAKYVVDNSTKDLALSFSFEQDLGLPPAQTVNADDIRKQPIQQKSVQTIKVEGESDTFKGWSTPIHLDPEDAPAVRTGDIRIFTIHPQEVEGATLALPAIVNFEACDKTKDDLRRVEAPAYIAAHQRPVSDYIRTMPESIKLDVELRPTPDKNFKSGYKLFIDPDEDGTLPYPDGMLPGVRRVGTGRADKYGNEIPDRNVIVTLQHGVDAAAEANEEPKTLVLANGKGNKDARTKQLKGMRSTAWSYSSDVTNPNEYTDHAKEIVLRRGFPYKDDSTGETLMVAATVTFDGGEWERTADLTPRNIGTKNPTIGKVEVDYSQYNVGKEFVFTGIGDTLIGFAKYGAGKDTAYRVCGAGVDVSDGLTSPATVLPPMNQPVGSSRKAGEEQSETDSKKRTFVLHCGKDMYTK